MRAASAVRNLWERTRDRARGERKTPVLVLFAKGKPGGLIVVHQDDLAAVAAELAPFPLPAGTMVPGAGGRLASEGDRLSPSYSERGT